VNGWKRSSERRTGGFGAAFRGGDEDEPNWTEVSSVAFVCWPNSENVRLFVMALGFDRPGLDCCDRATRENGLEICGVKAYEHLLQICEAADRAKGSI
jgi:hypothetical protein